MPTTKFDWNQVPQLRRDRIGEAEKYAERLNHGLAFYEWLHVGDGLIEWRDAALELAGTQDVTAQAYRDAWRVAKPNYPHLTSIAEDKAVRSYAIWAADNRGELEAWYAGLSHKQRRNWNHPRTIWNHSPLGQAAKAAKRATEELKPRKTAVRDLQDVTARIETVSDNLERTQGGASVLAFDMTPELIAESARVFIDVYGPADTARFVTELQALLAPPTVPAAPLDPSFTSSLAAPKRRSRKRPTEPKAERHWDE